MFKSLIARFHRPQQPVQVRVVNRDILRLSLDEWRQDRALCASAHAALADKTVRAMLDCMRTTSMLNWALDIGTPLDQRAVHAARCEGYVMALNDFESLAVEPKAAIPEEPTFQRSNFDEMFVQPS